MSVNSPQSGSQFSLPAIQPGTSLVLAFTGASAQSAVIGGTCVRLCASQDVWVKFGPNPTADKTASIFMPSGSVEYFMCNATDKVAALQDSAGGNLSITPGTETGI